MDQILFEHLPLSEELLRAVSEMGFTAPTPIQSQSIPLILEGHDVVGRSQTGTGKTAAFGIPAIQMVDPSLDRRMAQVLLLCPTRELAVQACEELKKLARYCRGVHVCAVYGGAPIERQIVQLKDANIIVGTPGRVMDHLRRRTLKISDLRMVILDEADEMLSMGFREDIETILTEAPEERQTVLFSATMPPEIMKLIDSFQKDPELVEINKSQVALNSIEQFYYDIPTGRKNDALALLLHYHEPKRSIIFCNTKRMVEDLSNWLIDHGFKAEGLHGDLKQSQRTVVMNSFKAGRTAILVATDVAARGIDVDDINCVFNYDIPQNAEYYVHRIGRTGRAGKSGCAYTLCCGRFQLRQMEQISRIAKAEAVLAPVPMPEEILTKQREHSAQELAAVLLDKEDFPYMSAVESLCENFTPEQVAAAALELLYGSKSKNLPDGKGINREKKRRSPKDYVKLLINAGYNARMVPNFIVGAIAERTNLSGRDIGKIEIFDDNTTVEVPKDQAEDVLNAMQDCRINGQDVAVSVMKASVKPQRNNDNRSYKKNNRRDSYEGKKNRDHKGRGNYVSKKDMLDQFDHSSEERKESSENFHGEKKSYNKGSYDHKKGDFKKGSYDHKKGDFKKGSYDHKKGDFKKDGYKKPYSDHKGGRKKSSYAERFESYDKNAGGKSYHKGDKSHGKGNFSKHR